MDVFLDKTNGKLKYKTYICTYNFTNEFIFKENNEPCSKLHTLMHLIKLLTYYSYLKKNKIGK